MPSSAVVLSVAGAYLVACLVVGMLPGRKTSDTAQGYVAGDRALGLLVMYFITGATIFSAFAFLGAPGWAYSRGVAVLYILAYGAFGFLPFYWLGPRAARLGREYGFVTQAEMVANRFRTPALAGVMALISTLAFVPYLALQMEGAGYVLNVVSRDAIPEWVGAGVVYGVVLVYVMKSGVLGVGWTNTFQGIFMMVLAWGLGLYLPYVLYGGVGEMFRGIASERPELLVAPGLKGGSPWNWGEYTTYILVSVIGFSVWPHLFMKAFTARDERTLRRTVVLYPTFQVFLVPIMIIGFCGVLFEPPPESGDQVLVHVLMNTELPALLVGLFCAGALAASMSSGDAMVHATASILVRDGLVTAGGRQLSSSTERTLIRALLVVVLLAAYGLTFLYDGSLVELLAYSYGPVVQFAPAVWATLYVRRATGAGVLAGLVAGIAVNSLFVYEPAWRPYPLHAGIYGLVANIVALVVVSLATRPHGDEEERRFLEVAAGD